MVKTRLITGLLAVITVGLGYGIVPLVQELMRPPIPDICAVPGLEEGIQMWCATGIPKNWTFERWRTQ